MKKSPAFGIALLITIAIALACFIASISKPSASNNNVSATSENITTTVEKNSTASQSDSSTKKTSTTSQSGSSTKKTSTTSYSDKNDYGYGDPKPGDSLVDYMKREDGSVQNKDLVI